MKLQPLPSSVGTQFPQLSQCIPSQLIQDQLHPLLLFLRGQHPTTLNHYSWTHTQPPHLGWWLSQTHLRTPNQLWLILPLVSLFLLTLGFLSREAMLFSSTVLFSMASTSAPIVGVGARGFLPGFTPVVVPWRNSSDRSESHVGGCECFIVPDVH